MGLKINTNLNKMEIFLLGHSTQAKNGNIIYLSSCATNKNYCVSYFLDYHLGRGRPAKRPEKSKLMS